jgi:hypothetical protein
MTRAKRPNKLKCIREYCRDCAGESTREVDLCHLFDCPLWEYRTGNHVSSPTYKKRMAGSIARSSDEVRELEQMGINVALFGVPLTNMKHGEKKDGPK